jgi:tetratricopeptide (TPR) repeat protein
MMRCAVLVVCALVARAAHADDGSAPPPGDGSAAPVPGDGSAAPRPDDAPANDAARSKFERAKQLHRAGEYKAAADLFREAYELDPQPEYMFGRAQALRKAGDCPAAIELYKKVLEQPLDKIDAGATRQSMALCEVKQPPPVVVVPAPWYRDWRAPALVGSGLVMFGAGTWMTLQSIFDERAAQDATQYGEHDRLTERATVLRAMGIGALAFGAVVGAVGVYRYTKAPRQRVISAWVNRGSGGLALGGTW